MADRIKGITIELDGDTTKLSNALKGVNKEIRDTQSNLKDVNKLLKMDPGNADLLAQKQKHLREAIDATVRGFRNHISAVQPGARKQRTFGETPTAINGTVTTVNWYRSDGSLVLKNRKPSHHKRLSFFLTILLTALPRCVRVQQ